MLPQSIKFAFCLSSPTFPTKVKRRVNARPLCTSTGMPKKEENSGTKVPWLYQGRPRSENQRLVFYRSYSSVMCRIRQREAKTLYALSPTMPLRRAQRKNRLLKLKQLTLPLIAVIFKGHSPSHLAIPTPFLSLSFRGIAQESLPD